MMKVIMPLAIIGLTFSACKPDVESTSTLREGSIYSNETACQTLIRESQNDAKRQGGVDPFPVFRQNKQTRLASLKQQLDQCKSGTKVSQTPAAGPDGSQDEVLVASNGNDQQQAQDPSVAGEPQFESQQPESSSEVLFGLTGSCAKEQKAYDEINACVMPGSVEKTIDIAIDCALGELKKKLGGNAKYGQIIESCTSVTLTHNGSYSAKVDPKACITKIVEELGETAGATAATAFSRSFGSFVTAVKCAGGISVNIVGGALESWTADINTHWRPGETHLDGRPVVPTTDPKKKAWEQNSCNFNGNIPDRSWWPSQSGTSACLSGCQAYTKTGLIFKSVDQGRAACVSKCEHICNKCCGSSSCQKPHAPNGNTDGMPLCKWY